jgi:IS1 family transposase
MTGVAKHTILKLLKDLGCAAASYHNSHVRNLRVRRLQCDEIWAFVYGKDKNLTLEQVQTGLGSVWTWTALDADTKLIVSYMIGDRGAATALNFLRDLAGRVTSRIQLTTDGHRVYADAVEDAFGAEIDYAMLVKIYGASNDTPEFCYSPATCIECRTGVLADKPNPDHISTSFVERSNLSVLVQFALVTAKVRPRRHSEEPRFHQRREESHGR